MQLFQGQHDTVGLTTSSWMSLVPCLLLLRVRKINLFAISPDGWIHVTHRLRRWPGRQGRRCREAVEAAG